MRCFDGHCDTLARCMATGEGLRQNTGHVDLARCAARLGQNAHSIGLGLIVNTRATF